MGFLKAKGIVDSEGGHGRGWTLQRPLVELTIRDVQVALDQGPELKPGISNDHPICPVERTTNAALTTAFWVVKDVIREEFSRRTLAELA